MREKRFEVSGEILRDWSGNMIGRVLRSRESRDGVELWRQERKECLGRKHEGGKVRMKKR